MTCPRGTSPLRSRFVFRLAGPQPPPLLPLSIGAVVAVSPVIPIASPAVLCFAPLPSLDPPPSNLPSPLPSLRLLHPPAPPLAPPPIYPAADIACKDEYTGNRTGRGEACWLTADGSAPHRKGPSRPLYVVEDGINRSLFLH